MLKPLLSFLALLAPVAATSQTLPNDGEWTIAGSDLGCIAHASSPGGTVLSVVVARNVGHLLFVLQNRKWISLRDGSVHRVHLSLDDAQEYEFRAIARTNLDADGPGLIFSVPPEAAFIGEFAAATGMKLDQDGKRLDSLAIAGSQAAMEALASCVAAVMTGSAEDPELATKLNAQPGKRQRI